MVGTVLIAQGQSLSSTSWHLPLDPSARKVFNARDSADVLVPSVQPFNEWLQPAQLRPNNEWFQGLAVDGDVRQIVGDLNAQAATYGLSLAGAGHRRLAYEVNATRWRLPLGFPLAHEASSHRTMDGLGRASVNSQGIAHVERLVGHVSCALSPSVSVRFGQESHHWGPGARSLFLDRHMAPAPGARLWVDAGIVQYAHLLLRTRHTLPGLDSAEVGWMASHLVEVALGRGWSGAVFGAVKWHARDTYVEGRVEPHYLVPFAAFRPMEYSQGSPDNALAGAQLTWRGRTKRQHRLTSYSQVLFDEFYWRNLQDNPGWWANKWGVLAGTHFETRSGKFGGLVEGAAVRPWTYTHKTQPNSYSHNHQPLGHPAGGNFVEGRVRLRAALPQDLTLRVSVLRRWQGISQGGDEFLLGFAAGEMPWISYQTRDGDDGHGWLQGTVADLTRVEVDVAYPVGDRVGVGGVEVFGRAWTRIERRSDLLGWMDPWDVARLEVGIRQSRVMDERDW